MTSIRKRVLRTMSAHAFGQGVNVLIQILSLPILISGWGAEKYGNWLLISAIPMYLSMSDAGLITSAGNNMTMLMSKGRTADAQHQFSSAIAFQSLVSLLGIILAATAWSTGNHWLPNVKTEDVASTVSILTLGVFVAFWGGLSLQLCRATNRNAEYEFINNLIRLAEWAGQLGGFFYDGTFTSTALGGLITRALGTAAGAIYASKKKTGLGWSIKGANTQTIRKQLQDGVGFLAFPLANALNFQGFTIIVGTAFGASAVAQFNAYRTVARVAVQFTSLFSLSIWPEFSRNYHDRDAVVRLYRKAVKTGITIAAFMAPILIASGKYVIDHWSRGAITFNATLYYLMVAYAVASSVAHTSRTMLMATNTHSRLAFLTGATAIGSLAVAWAFAGNFGLFFVTGCLLIFECATTAGTLVLAQNVVYKR